MSRKSRKEAKKKMRAEKLDMYDMIGANLLAGNSLIEPEESLSNSEIAIGFSNIASEKQISKYFMIRQFPDWMYPRLFDSIRNKCVRGGVKINFYTFGNPYQINWDSAEMRNKMTVWKRYADSHSGDIDVFDYRSQRSEEIARKRIITSTKYLNEAELDYKRSLVRVAFMIEITANRNEESILNMLDTMKLFKEFCSSNDIKYREIKVNMIDWLQTFGPFSLRKVKEVTDRASYKILTDDILANFNSYKQGRVGNNGVVLGLDCLSGVPVMRKFKADPDAPENWLISAETGGGKSYFVKTLLTYLLADNFVVTVMDYEGDEYLNLANYIRAGNPDDVIVVSLGKGSSYYFDPCAIPALTGDLSIDSELKENAISYIMSIFRIIVCGLKGTFTQKQEKVMSLAIQNMYDSAGVTEDMATWGRSKHLRLENVYEEIKVMVEQRALTNSDDDNEKHTAAIKIMDAASIYFEEGEAKYGAFKNPIPADTLYGAKFIVFSFGMRGASDSASDPVLLALKQLSVACVSIQISNYCKYVRHCFNVKVWEEYQRWGEAAGSAEIISNAMTGGRKRGDVNFIITNDLGAIIDDSNLLNKKLRQNVQNYAIGRIKVRSIRHEFCKMLDLQECEEALNRIASAYSSDDSGGKESTQMEDRFTHSFCLVLDNGKKAIVKVALPKALRESKLFRTGVDLKDKN